MQASLSDLLIFWRARRRLLLASAAIVCALLFFLYVVLPFVASTRIVKERIAFELSAWSGYQVSIGADPAIRLFPFRAVLSDVRLTDWMRQQQPVLAADEVIISLSPLSALIGDIAFNKVRLMKPVLRVEGRAGSVYLPRLPGAGRMANAVKDAQVLTRENPETPDLASFPGDPFGRVEFSEGRILEADSDEELIRDVEGVLSWPRLDRPGSLKAAGQWRGEAVIVELSSTEPMLLLAGGTAQMHVGVAGTAGNFSFDGTVNLSTKPYLDGRSALSTSSLRRMLAWSRAPIEPRPEVNAVSIQSRVQGDAERLKFEDMELVIDGDAGTGVVELLFNQAQPVVSGTLAFQQINLNSLLSVLAPVGASGAPPSGAVDTAFTERLNLDLRMSAMQAQAGSISLADVAATAQVRNGFAVFDISDARAFDGSLQFGLRLDRTAGGSSLETSIRAVDIDGAAFGQAVGLSHIVPAGRGGFSLMLKGPVNRWETITDHLDGSLSASFGPSILTGLDLPLLLRKIKEGGFFPLSDLAQGALSIDRIELKATIANNLARIDHARALAGRSEIRLSGVVSYPGRGLALTGIVDDSQAQPLGSGAAAFFVGGTWSAPFVSPAVVTPKTD